MATVIDLKTHQRRPTPLGRRKSPNKVLGGQKAAISRRAREVHMALYRLTEGNTAGLTTAIRKALDEWRAQAAADARTVERYVRDACDVMRADLERTHGPGYVEQLQDEPAS